MADIETSVAITAQTDDLQSGMSAAADAVEAATALMKSQFAQLGVSAQQAQAHIGAAAAQIGSTLSALQARTALLTGGVGGAIGQAGNSIARMPAISVSQAGGAESGGTPNRLPAWRAQLQSQLAAEQSFFSDSKAEELTFWQDKLALTEAGSKEQLAVENNIYQLQKQHAIQNERDTLASLSADERVTDAAYARQRAAIEEQAQLGKSSAAEEIAQLKDLLDTEWALEQDYYAKKLAAAQNDAQTQQKLTEQAALAYQQYLTDKDKLDAQAVENSQKQWGSLLQPIQRSLDTSITGIILGTTTVQKALSNLARSTVSEFVNSAVGGIFNNLGRTLGASVVGGSGSASGNQDFSGGVSGAGSALLGGGISEGVFGSGGLFGALGLGNLFSGGNLFSSLFGGIGSLFAFEKGGIVPSAAGGWAVPSLGSGGVLAQLHSNEMVLPANISQGLQGMIAGGGGGHTFNISAVDANSVARLFMTNGSALVQALNGAIRNGAALRAAN
jgi:hypothetical protein